MKTSFDIVMREDDFVLYSDGKPLLTANNNEVAHTNMRLLRQAVINEISSKESKIKHLNLLARISDVRAGVEEPFFEKPEDLIGKDPVLSNSPVAQAGKINDILTDNPALSDFIFLSASSLASSFNNFKQMKEEGITVNEYLIQSVKELSLEQQVVLNALCKREGTGIIIHLLLLRGFLSLSEYCSALTVMNLKNDQPLVDSVKSEGGGILFKIKRQLEKEIQVALDFFILCKSENKVSVVEEIIERGEDSRTEFKSTFRWDIRQGKKNPAIEHASLKTLCAFLNSDGGDLLIGVRDDGSIEGIETDQFPNDDRFLLHLWTLIKTCMGQEVVDWVKTSLQKFGGKTVCRVSCRKAAKPVFLNQKGFDEAFYVRVGPSSSSLEISAALKYIEQHF